MNPYETLGVDPAASPEAIKRAYRKKAKQSHPDSSTGDRTKFEAINRASLILLNPERRAKFDATGDDSEATPDNSQALAVSLIVGFIAAVVQQSANDGSNPCTVDLIAFCRENIRKRISDFEKQKKPIARAVELMALIDKRLKLSTGSKEHPMLRRALEAQARGTKEPLQRIEREITIHKDALILLNGYVFEADKPAPVQMNPNSGVEEQQRRSGSIVPRTEHEARWASTTKDLTLLSERLNELRTATSSTYTIRDEVHRMQTEVSELRRLLADRKTSP